MSLCCGALEASAFGYSRGRQLFAVAAMTDEVLFQRRYLPVKKIVGLMNKADNRIGDHGGIGMSQPLIIRAKGRTGGACFL
jgi:hypothetical protein